MSSSRGGLNNLKRKLQDLINDIDKYSSAGPSSSNPTRASSDLDQNPGNLVATVEPCYFERRLNSLGFTLMFSVIYYHLFQTRLFRTGLPLTMTLHESSLSPLKIKIPFWQKVHFFLSLNAQQRLHLTTRTLHTCPQRFLALFGP